MRLIRVAVLETGRTWKVLPLLLDTKPNVSEKKGKH